MTGQLTLFMEIIIYFENHKKHIQANCRFFLHYSLMIDLYLLSSLPYAMKLVDFAALLSLVTSIRGNKVRTYRGMQVAGL
jgi:hypothetical protein